MWEHPQPEYKLLGMPCVHKGYRPPHTKGARALLGSLPYHGGNGNIACGPLWDTSLGHAAMLLCVLKQYQRVVTQLGATIITLHCKQLYSTTRFSDEFGIAFSATSLGRDFVWSTKRVG